MLFQLNEEQHRRETDDIEGNELTERQMELAKKMIPGIPSAMFWESRYGGDIRIAFHHLVRALLNPDY